MSCPNLYLIPSLYFSFRMSSYNELSNALVDFRLLPCKEWNTTTLLVPEIRLIRTGSNKGLVPLELRYCIGVLVGVRGLLVLLL